MKHNKIILFFMIIVLIFTVSGCNIETKSVENVKNTVSENIKDAISKIHLKKPKKRKNV